MHKREELSEIFAGELMEHKSCLVLHPNAAFVYKVDNLYIELTQRKFETQFGITGSNGIEHSSVDLQFDGRRARVRSLKVVQLNEVQDSIADAATSYKGKIVSQEVVGDNLRVTLKNKDGGETSYVGITKVTRVKPVYTLNISGEVNNNHDNVVSLSTKTHMRYVLTSITTEVHYALYLAKSDEEDAELEQTLFVKNNSDADHTAFLCYNSAPYITAPTPMRFETYAARSAQVVPDLDVLRPKTISIGEHTLEKEATIPVGLAKLPNLHLHFEVHISLLSSTKNKQAIPAIKIPLTAGDFVEGQLKIFDSKGYYLTAGQLKIGSKTAYAYLRPVYYGVRVDSETSIDVTHNILTTSTQLTAFNSGSVDAVLMIEYDKRLQFSTAFFLRQSTHKIRVVLPPGKSTHDIKLSFTRVKTESTK